jgi:hypothetical protein
MPKSCKLRPTIFSAVSSCSRGREYQITDVHYAQPPRRAGRGRAWNCATAAQSESPRTMVGCVRVQRCATSTSEGGSVS